MTVSQLWQSLYSEVITLANRNVQEGLAENNAEQTNKRRLIMLNHELIYPLVFIIIFSPWVSGSENVCSSEEEKIQQTNSNSSRHFVIIGPIPDIFNQSVLFVTSTFFARDFVNIFHPMKSIFFFVIIVVVAMIDKEICSLK